jgi:hypothetical protein
VNKALLIGGLALGGTAAFVAWNKLRAPYEEEEIDSSGAGDFGERGAEAPEQRWAPATTRTDVTVEELSTAARVETGFPAIHEVWPSLTLDELRPAEGDLEKLAELIAGKVEQPRAQVRGRLDEIIGAETPRPSYPAQ